MKKIRIDSIDMFVPTLFAIIFDDGSYKICESQNEIEYWHSVE